MRGWEAAPWFLRRWVGARCGGVGGAESVVEGVAGELGRLGGGYGVTVGMGLGSRDWWC